MPLDSTFYSRIERGLNAGGTPPRAECIAIAMAGYSTLQSYLECGRWMDTLALDRVVYVFCENDPGNHVPSLNMSDAVPYPVLDGDSLVIDRSFAVRYANKRRWSRRVWQYLKSHTLLFSTLETRVHFLRSRGVRVHVDDAERFMGTPAGPGGPISANSPPSMLSDSLRTLCTHLTERVLLDWKHNVETRGRTFAILCIPRASELKKPEAERDSWVAWLLAFGRANGIEIIDPTARFARAEERGHELYYDHLTGYGHAEMAAEFLERGAATHDR